MSAERLSVSLWFTKYRNVILLFLDSKWVPFVKLDPQSSTSINQSHALSATHYQHVQEKKPSFDKRSIVLSYIICSTKISVKHDGLFKYRSNKLKNERVDLFIVPRFMKFCTGLIIYFVIFVFCHWYSSPCHTDKSFSRAQYRSTTIVNRTNSGRNFRRLVIESTAS